MNMVRKYAMTEDEFLSGRVDPVDGHLKFTRENGDTVDMGVLASASNAGVASFVTADGPTKAALGATIEGLAAEKPLARGRRHVRQFDFTQKAVAASGRYLIPGMVDSVDGAFVLAYRDGSKHDLSAGSDYGKLYVRRSVDDGETWNLPALVADHSTTQGDVRDPFLYREPGARRIHLTYFVDKGSGVRDGTWITFSDDDGRTWATPKQVTTGTSSSGGELRRSADGVWRMPVYRQQGGFWRASIVSAADPLGQWSAPVDIYAPSSQDATEADFVEVSEANWIAVVRVNGAQAVVLQSTDKGASWSAPTQLSTISGRLYQGWPSLRLSADKVLLFVRANGGGGGLQVLRLLDVGNPLVAESWSEPGQVGRLGGYLATSSGGFVGKFQPFQINGVWVGSYMAETNGNAEAEVRIGRYAGDAQASAFSFIPTGQGPADGSTGWQGFATPSKVVVRSSGGWYRIRWQLRSAQPSGTISNYQVEVAVDGTRLNQNAESTSSTWYTVGGTTQPVANSAYHASKEGVAWLSPGLHEVEILVYQQTTTVGRVFSDRFLLVEPLS